MGMGTRLRRTRGLVLLSILRAGARRMATCALSDDDGTAARASRPFADLKISSWEPLRAIQGRSLCPNCACSRKFYCYTCCVLVGLDRGLVPIVSLPVHVDIIKHPLEVSGKSTAIHACVLAPSAVSLHIHPDIPSTLDPTSTVLVYPTKDALSVAELVSRLRGCPSSLSPPDTTSPPADQSPAASTATSLTGPKDTASPRMAESNPTPPSGAETPWHRLQRVVFIDSTWQQSHSVISDGRLRHLTSVRLSDPETHFWRPQRKTTSHLATIEAFYYFFREMEFAIAGSYDGRYDNLLYFYAYQHGVVQEAMAQRHHPKLNQSDGSCSPGSEDS